MGRDIFRAVEMACRQTKSILRFRIVLFALVAGFAAWGALALLRGTAAQERKAVAAEFRPTQVVPAQRAIVNAPVMAAQDVKDQVTGKELVLGVVVKGEARAYPINMLTGPSREIINDTLGNSAIAATW